MGLQFEEHETGIKASSWSYCTKPVSLTAAQLLASTAVPPPALSSQISWRQLALQKALRSFLLPTTVYLQFPTCQIQLICLRFILQQHWNLIFFRAAAEVFSCSTVAHLDRRLWALSRTKEVVAVAYTQWKCCRKHTSAWYLYLLLLI